MTEGVKKERKKRVPEGVLKQPLPVSIVKSKEAPEASLAG